MDGNNPSAAADNSVPTADEAKLIGEVLGAEPTVTEPSKEGEEKTDPKPEKSEETPSEKPQENNDEKPEGDKPTEEKPTEEQPAAPAAAAGESPASPQISRIDKRIAKLAVTNGAIAGREIDYEHALSIINGKSFEDKKQILHDLLQENARFRGSDKKEISEEDLEALAEARAEAIVAERELAEEQEAEVERQKGWHTKLASIIETNPVLKEGHKSYDPKLADALELMLSDDGQTPRYAMDPGVAWEKVQKAAGIAQERAEREAEVGRQRSLSGAINGVGGERPRTGKYTWEELAAIQAEDPDRYEKIIQAGKDLPDPVI